MLDIRVKSLRRKVPWSRALGLVLAILLSIVWTRPLRESAELMVPVYHPARNIMAGFVFPGWIANSPQLHLMSTGQWEHQVSLMISQTHSSWIEIQVALYQPNVYVPKIGSGVLTPGIGQLRQEILFARRRGLKVIMAPTVLVGNAVYSGDIHYPSAAKDAQWFHSYLTHWAPYAKIARETHVNILVVASEMDGMLSAPASQWESLIQQLHQNFSGALWVDLNWIDTTRFEPWLKDPLISAVGISAYFPLESKARPLSYATIFSRWKTRIDPQLENLIRYSGHPAVLSELGYKNAANALYQPYRHTTSLGPDPTLQNNALVAAVMAATQVRGIAGIMVYGWDIGYFSPSTLAKAIWLETGVIRPTLHKIVS
ncbi:MAG: hypothetical protein M1493_07865 [Firmicutes bacterium]|jgi:hypothetical protein|uniref:Glycoside hydrolase family 5 domain-containing protein n=1 Tax=Sulfobacillus benefaciens TaxID=453960 RepID=A0A2T2WXL2_9FIRM|nr:hypothetical protein [Bacillota bacterium]PSR26980.1 MAG: hypothetical protein C7B43_12485 [Sulfobacillus benefaciens]